MLMGEECVMSQHPKASGNEIRQKLICLILNRILSFLPGQAKAQMRGLVADDGR